MPATVSNSLAARCCVLPTAMVPMLSLPGCARACATRSLSVANLEAAGTNNPRSKLPIRLMGVKSFKGSYGNFLNSETLTAWPLLMSSRVCPSGRAEATAWLATMLPALGLFSTTTACPRVRAICSATARAVRSAIPPGANGTTSVMGRSGNRAASAQPAAMAGSRPAVAAFSAVRRRRQKG